MLLNELSTSSDKKIARINRLLRESYGFVLSSNIDTDKLTKLSEKIARDIHNLKMNGQTPKDAEYAKKLLVREGIASMLAKQQINEGMSGPGSNVYRRVISWLTDYACKLIDIGDSVDEAITDAMRHYRSSKYRFPDFEIEHDLRKSVAECTDEPVPADVAEPVMLYDGMYEDSEEKKDSDTSMRVWEVWIKNNYYDGKYADYSARPFPVVASSKEEARQVVLDNADEILQKLLARKFPNGKRVLPPKSALPITDDSIGRIEDGTKHLKRSPSKPVEFFTPTGKQTLTVNAGRIEEGTLFEDEDGASHEDIVDAITHRITVRHLDLLDKHGPEKVMNAIENVAEFYVGAPELGSSDVSIMVREVMRDLGENLNEETFGAQQRRYRDEMDHRAATFVPPKFGETGHEEHVRVEQHEMARQLAHKMTKKIHDKKNLDLTKFHGLTKKFKDQILALFDKGMSYEDIERKLLKKDLEEKAPPGNEKN